MLSVNRSALLPSLPGGKLMSTFSVTSCWTTKQIGSETDWQWEAVKGDKPRNFCGAFILLSDKPPKEILHYVRVDLGRSFKGSVRIKEM